MDEREKNIQELHVKLIENGKLIHNLRQETRKNQKYFIKQQKEFLLDLIMVLDSFESKEERTSTKFGEEIGRKVNKHFLTVKKRIMNILELNNVSKIELEHYIIDPKVCIVEDTVKDKSKNNDYIMEIIKSGYKIQNETLRFAEIIIVKND